MKKIIKSITKLKTSYHPAVGYKYEIIFTDLTRDTTDDDQLIGQFGMPQVENPHTATDLWNHLIGQQFTLNDDNSGSYTFTNPIQK